MRSVLLALVAVAALETPVFAQNWANKVFGGSPETPIVHDFGVVARGAQLQTTMKMTNIYKVPLSVTNIRVSCGCVDAKAVPEVIPPNGQATLVIKMDGTRFTGSKTVNVYVTFGPQFVSTANIIVSANARQDVVLNPGEIDFGSVQKGQSVTRSLEVECAGKKDWKVVEIQKSGKAPFDLKVENMPTRTNNGFQVIGYKLVATLRSDAPTGSFRETVDLKTNDPTQPIVTFYVAGAVATPVAVAPNPVQLAGLKIGTPMTAKVVVTANQPFRITGVQGNGADVSIVIPDRPATPTHILDVQINPQTPGLLNREIILQTDMRGESVKIVVQGNVNP